MQRSVIIIAVASQCAKLSSAVVASQSLRIPVKPLVDAALKTNSQAMQEAVLAVERETVQSKSRPTIMRRQEAATPEAEKFFPHYGDFDPAAAPGVSNTMGAPAPCPPEYFADCPAYMESTGCQWTIEYSCPGQPEGSIGTAEFFFPHTPDFRCCCEKGLWKVTEAVEQLMGATEASPIQGIFPGTQRPKLILAQDVDWPPYAYVGQPPESDYDVAGLGHDIAMGMGELCGIDVETVQTPWKNCWDGADGGKIGRGLETGLYHGCMTYTHTEGTRGRFLEWSYAILKKDRKPAGFLTLLNADGSPKISPESSLAGKKVVDVAGWAPLAEGIAYDTNKCTNVPFGNYTLVTPKDTDGNVLMGNDAAMKMLRDGHADVMYVYADQAHNYECNTDGTAKNGATPAWDCALWKGFGTEYAYIQTGMFGFMVNGTTLTVSRKGSGLPELINPCLQEFMGTKDYFEICKKHDQIDSCYENKFFPSADAYNYTTHAWETPTNLQTTSCASGYCGCQVTTTPTTTTLATTTTTVTTATTAATTVTTATTTVTTATTTTTAHAALT